MHRLIMNQKQNWNLSPYLVWYWPSLQSPGWSVRRKYHSSSFWKHRFFFTLLLEKQTQNRPIKVSILSNWGFSSFTSVLLCLLWLNWLFQKALCRIRRKWERARWRTEDKQTAVSTCVGGNCISDFKTWKCTKV